MSFAVVLRTGPITNMAFKGGGALGCLATFAVLFHSASPLRGEFCMAHMFLAFCTTLATAGDVTQPWHQSTLSGLLASAILLWPSDDTQGELSVVTVWMSSFTAMAISTVITGVLVSLWCPTTTGRTPTVTERDY
ncbi:hypothetical protein V5799_013184 [Amblyomma americanum]|uniref:Uncharacterized protein n=1 Tax=Amblyomma americanum TaxID=6943 RepID=A0AAQ4E6P3_AMBAM